VPMKRGGGLTDKARAFAREYPIDMNGTAAATRAGYSAQSARKTACKLLQDPRVKALIDEAVGKAAAKAGLTQQQVLEDIARIGRKAERAKRFDAALRASELQGKYLKMWVEKHEHTGKDGGPVQTESTVQFYLPTNGRDG